MTIASNFQPSQDEIPLYVASLWRLAKAIDTDPGWIRWWSGSPLATIELYPSPDGEVDVVSVHREADRLQVRGSSRALAACLAEASTREEADRMLVEAPARRLFLDLIRAMFTGAARQLNLDQPPPLPGIETASAGSLKDAD